MKKVFEAPVFKVVLFTNDVAFAARCNFATQRDDCSNQQYK